MAKDTSTGGGTSGGAPDAPKSSGDPLLDQLQQTLWDIFKVKMDPGTLLGLADPAIDKRAKNDAASVRKWLKPGHLLLHPAMNYGLGMLSGRIDAVADTKPEPIKSLLRKGSDYLDSFRGEIFGKDTGEHELPKMDAPGSAEFLKVLARCRGELVADNLRLFLETLPEDMDEVDAHIAKRTRKFCENTELLLNSPKKEPEPKVTFGERMDRFNEVMDRELGPAVQQLEKKIERMNARTKALQTQQRQEAAAKQPSGTDKFLKRLSRVLFGFPKTIN